MSFSFWWFNAHRFAICVIFQTTQSSFCATAFLITCRIHEITCKASCYVIILAVIANTIQSLMVPQFSMMHYLWASLRAHPPLIRLHVFLIPDAPCVQFSCRGSLCSTGSTFAIHWGNNRSREIVLFSSQNISSFRILTPFPVWRDPSGSKMYGL